MRNSLRKKTLCTLFIAAASMVSGGCSTLAPSIDAQPHYDVGVNFRVRID